MKILACGVLMWGGAMAAMGQRPAPSPVEAPAMPATGAAPMQSATPAGAPQAQTAQAASTPTVPLAPMMPIPGATSVRPSEKTISGLQARALDFAQLSRYREENAKLGDPKPGEKRVVFYGDSITDGWGRRAGKFFPDKPWINRGIGGQTTQQMVVRFQQDVVRLKPVAVVILAGTNDIAGNTGPENLEMVKDGLRSMVAIARDNGIKVVLSSVLPAKKFLWAPDVQPAQPIREINRWIEDYCAKEKLTFLNYYPALVDSEGGMKEELATDKTVHPNTAGYAIMEPLAQSVVEKVLGR